MRNFNIEEIKNIPKVVSAYEFPTAWFGLKNCRDIMQDESTMYRREAKITKYDNIKYIHSWYEFCKTATPHVLENKELWIKTIERICPLKENEKILHLATLVNTQPGNNLRIADPYDLFVGRRIKDPSKYTDYSVYIIPMELNSSRYEFVNTVLLCVPHENDTHKKFDDEFRNTLLPLMQYVEEDVKIPADTEDFTEKVLLDRIGKLRFLGVKSRMVYE